MRPGTRVELVALTDAYDVFRLSVGDRGSVAFTDSLGTIHIEWDSGRRVGIDAGDAGLLRPAGP